MSVATASPHRRAIAANSSVRFLEDLLDELQVTDREYHHLNLSIPLAARMLEGVRRAVVPGDRVLLVGGTMLLAEALLRLDVDLEIWRLPQQFLSPQTDGCVLREVTPECLTTVDLPRNTYHAVLLPYVIESMPDQVLEFLRKARKSLVPGGRAILATRNQSRMDARFAAIAGKPLARHRPAGSMSLSWPALPVRNEYHEQELHRLVRDAGFNLELSRFIDGSRLFLDLEPMPIEAYMLKKFGQAARRFAPAMRDTILVELSLRPGEEGLPTPTPDVCIAISAISGGDGLRRVLSNIQDQTYPHNRYEVVVLHDGRREDVRTIIAASQNSASVPVREVVDDSADGPATRNQALRETRASIVGHTDDACIIPVDWIEAAVIRFDEDTAVLTGPVLAGPDSHPKYFDVPGTRPDPAERELWRTDLFPISNVFYRASAVRALGGFDVGFENASGPAFGWDADLAWRLQRAGWQSRFCETLSISTVFRGPRSRSAVEQVRRAQELPQLYARVPEVRNQLVASIFASRLTMYFDFMLAGALLSALRRNPIWLLASIPWLSQVSRRFGVWPPRKWVPSARVVAKIAALQLLWLGGLVKGSVRARRIVL